MRRFDTRKEAEVEQNRLIRQAEELGRRKTEPPKLKDAVEYWLKSKEGAIAHHTLRAYRQVADDYTHAVREDPEVMDKLNTAYGLDEASYSSQSGVQIH